jgi:sigma-B regulation protein RsbU (phosphoserine phosphatase)
MAAFRALLRYNAKLFADPSELMHLMNEHVSEFMRKRDFISIFYGMLDYNEHTFSYCNCGHNPALHYSSDIVKLLEGGGPSLNLLKDAQFKTTNLNIDKNDRILFYTDGVVEVFNKDKKQFGLEKLIETFNSNAEKYPKEIIEQIISAIKNFSSSDFYGDDFTLLVLKRND